MPRNVRNFWLELDVDGRRTVATGPQAKDGGFSLSIRMRDNGGITRAMQVSGYAEVDGSLRLVATAVDSRVIEGVGGMTLRTHRDK